MPEPVLRVRCEDCGATRPALGAGACPGCGGKTQARLWARAEDDGGWIEELAESLLKHERFDAVRALVDAGVAWLGAEGPLVPALKRLRERAEQAAKEAAGRAADAAREAAERAAQEARKVAARATQEAERLEKELRKGGLRSRVRGKHVLMGVGFIVAVGAAVSQCDPSPHRTFSGSVVQPPDPACAGLTPYRCRLHKACETHDRRACGELGEAFEVGNGGARDLVEAAARYERACKLDDAQGCFDLSQLLRHGNGIATDVPKADELKARACTLGYISACGG